MEKYTTVLYNVKLVIVLQNMNNTTDYSSSSKYSGSGGLAGRPSVSASGLRVTIRPTVSVKSVGTPNNKNPSAA